MLTKSCEKVAKKFGCKICDYNTDRKSSYDKHLMTSKHFELTKDNQNVAISCNNINLQQYICKKCNKEYKSRVGLWKHNKICIIDTYIENTSSKLTDNNIDTNIIKAIVNENKTFKEFMLEQSQDFKTLIIELLKKETINNQINNISNCNNKSFNLNFFLNEQCKDALNINEFVDSIKMQLTDLEEFANLGYADGVSNIFVKGINALEVHKRPIHCSDAKREVLYIKNNDEWIKESDDKPLIKSAIKRVAFKNIKQINEWVKENPSCKDTTTKKFDQYNKIVMNSMSGVTEEEQKDNIEKIVKNVTKAVVIEKYLLK